MKKSVGTLSFLIYVCISILHPIAASATGLQKTDSIRTNDPTAEIISFDKYNGLVTSFEQLITGKIPGVQIMSNNGSPTGGNSIRIRGGGTVFGNSDPLIVLDGMPLDTKGIQGNRYNFNSLINPNDIETITILKDAYQTSVYGINGSNGVILINTKKPLPGKLKINFSTTNALQTPSSHSKVLTADQYRNFINTQGSTEQKALLGLESTDWDKVIYQTAFATDNHISISAEPVKNVPITASIGYLNQDGILKTDNTNRLSANINIRPSFFNNYLQLGIHLMGTANNNRFADTEAISSAQIFNPTLAVFSKNSNYGVFNEPYNGFLLNPLGILKQRKNTSNVTRRLTDIDIRYRLHFLPDLTASLHFGSDVSTGDGSEIKTNITTSYFEHHSRSYLNANLNYKKFIPVMKCSLLAVVGYESITNKDSVHLDYTHGVAHGVQGYTTTVGPNLTSYGMIRLDFDSKYWLSGSLRREGSSIFGIRSIVLPAYNIGYNLLGNENLNWNKAINYLQLIAGYGMTYQSGRISNNELGNETRYSQYSQPTDIIENISEWETSKMYNLEIKLGLLNNRINTSINYYISNTKISIPTMLIGTTSQSIIKNIGNSSKHGIEFSVNATPISTKNLQWTVNLNFDYSKTKWVDFGTSGNQSSEQGSLFEDRIKMTQAGYQPKMFFVMQQIYDTNGKPIEGLYEDINGDAQINWSDQIRFHSYAPDMLFNFGTQINYKKWSAGCLFRASIGNYVYNAFNAYNEHAADLNANLIFNKPSDYLHTGFKSDQSQSSYFVENASFLKLDNVTLGYNVGEIAKGVNLKVGATVQNVFTMTKYKGVDPEISNGIDYGLYPRPRVFSMTVNLDF